MSDSAFNSSGGDRGDLSQGNSCTERFIPLGSLCVGVHFQLQSSWMHIRIKSLLGFRCSQVNVSKSRSDLFACRPGFIYTPLLRGTAAVWAFCRCDLFYQGHRFCFSLILPAGGDQECSDSPLHTGSDGQHVIGFLPLL